jgi:catechol 2,3-dioxygenase-like lactoylglutathione lyase family enzyme
VPCTDLDRARKFYIDTLGLTEFEFPIPEDAAGRQSEEQVLVLSSGGGTMLVVYERETPTKADHTAAGWMVSNFNEVANKLINRGITFEVYPEMEGVEWDARGVGTSTEGYHGAWFKDPEGNILSLYEMPE